ncbi:NAD(P)/FAD-dependent oxidoreductase, partial [Pseudoalteromonas sp. SIMBA_153]
MSQMPKQAKPVKPSNSSVGNPSSVKKSLDNHYDVIIIGAGASGLYCALTAGRRGRRVLVLDHANKAGKKIL